MANVVASVLPLHERAMPFLAHLEELRRRIIFAFLECSSDSFVLAVRGPTVRFDAATYYSSIAASWAKSFVYSPIVIIGWKRSP